MNIFSLTETEFFQKLTEGKNDNLHIALVSFINKALCFVRQTLSHYKEIDFRTISEENMLDRLGLDWKANKTDLIELGYAFKVANCFGTKLSAKDIIGRLARIFKVDMTESYIYKKYSEMRMRGRNSRTYFMDTLIDGLNSFMSKQDQEG